MNRRRLLGLCPAAIALARTQKQPAAQKDVVTASATDDRTPRVGIVLSSFQGSSDHDGAPIRGLAHPRPANADLTFAQTGAMVRKAIELGCLRQGGLATIVAPEDWVVVKIDLAPSHGPAIRGATTEPGVVHSVVGYLLEQKRGRRFTIAAGSAGGWADCKTMIEDLARRHPGVRFDFADLDRDECLETPVEGRAAARNNPEGVYWVPTTIRQCDRIISIAPLKTDAATGVALSMGNYFGIAPASKYGPSKEGLWKLGDPEEVLIDLFSYHPADYAVLGGSWGAEHSASGLSAVRHNVVIASPNAVAADAVGAAIMGFDPAGLRFLRLADERGLGLSELDGIWTRGNEIKAARREFRKPPRWAKPRA